MFLDKDLYSDCENSSGHEDSLCWEHILVDKNCKDRQHNLTDRRNWWLRFVICIERSFHMGYCRTVSVVERRLVRLEQKPQINILYNFLKGL
jgi:hypothetical protein